jgi:hypothetical protein
MSSIVGRDGRLRPQPLWYDDRKRGGRLPRHATRLDAIFRATRGRSRIHLGMTVSVNAQTVGWSHRLEFLPSYDSQVGRRLSANLTVKNEFVRWRVAVEPGKGRDAASGHGSPSPIFTLFKTRFLLSLFTRTHWNTHLTLRKHWHEKKKFDTSLLIPPHSLGVLIGPSD